MATAEFNGVIIAESDNTVMIDGNHYFPPDSLKPEYLAAAELTTACHWKGLASYYDIVVKGESAPNSAWYYPEPKDAAAEIRDHVAFYAPPVTVTN